MATKRSSTDLRGSFLDINAIPFSSICKLLLSVNMARPNMLDVVSLLSRHTSSLTVRHWEQAKRVLRYVSRTNA